MAQNDIKDNIVKSDIQIGDKLGQGGFGTVYKAKWKGQTVACKILKYSRQFRIFGNDPQNIMKSYVRELTGYNEIGGENILRMLGHCKSMTPSSVELIILTEFMDKGSLARVIKNEPDLSYRRKLDMSIKIARGMEKIHDEG
jgi:serine/threonine protein kinase